LVSVSQWISTNFEPDSAPAPQTVYQWLRAGKLEGIKIGGSWYLPSLNIYECLPTETVIETAEEQAELDFSFLNKG
jgi:hypothetical protein